MMKRTLYAMVLILILSILAAFFVVGCQSKAGDAKPGEEVNSNMSAQQKANISERKKRDEQ